MQRNEVVVLKLADTDFTLEPPFNKVYLFPNERKKDIGYFFKYALCMNTKWLSATMTRLRTPPTSRFTLKKGNTEVQSQSNLKQWFSSSLENRVAVVPLLTKRENKALRFKKLTSRRWSENYLFIDAYKSLFEDIEIITPTGVVESICNGCPRQLLQLAGECHPGQPVCVETVDVRRLVRTNKAVS